MPSPCSKDVWDALNRRPSDYDAAMRLIKSAPDLANAVDEDGICLAIDLVNRMDFEKDPVRMSQVLSLFKLMASSKDFNLAIKCGRATLFSSILMSQNTSILGAIIEREDFFNDNNRLTYAVMAKKLPNPVEKPETYGRVSACMRLLLERTIKEAITKDDPALLEELVTANADIRPYIKGIQSLTADKFTVSEWIKGYEFSQASAQLTASRASMYAKTQKIQHIKDTMGALTLEIHQAMNTLRIGNLDNQTKLFKGYL